MIPIRIINNLLTIFILVGLGWMIYQSRSGDKFDTFKERLQKIVGGGKDNGGYKFGRNR